MQNRSVSRRFVVSGLTAGTAALCLRPAFAGGSYVFVTAEVPPYSLPAVSGRTGFVVDIVRELLRRMDASFNLVSQPWRRAMETLRQGPQAFMVPLARTPEREPRFKWIATVISEEVRLYSIDDAPPLHLVAAADLPAISVQSGSAMEELGLYLGLGNLYSAPDNFSMVKMLV